MNSDNNVTLLHLTCVRIICCQCRAAIQNAYILAAVKNNAVPRKPKKKK